MQNFITLLEATHLLYRLPPFGDGKEILRPRYKLYLADPAIALAILMKGKSIIEDPKALGSAVEVAVFAHLKAIRTINTPAFPIGKILKTKNSDLVVNLSENNSF